MADVNGHRRHDPVSISASVDPGVPMAPSLATCIACFGLRADLLVLRSFLPTATTPRRRRDFRLTIADANRLRPRGWRGLVAAIGTTRDGFTRPLAASFTALGLAGILLGAAPGGFVLGTLGAAGATPVANPASIDAPRDSVTVPGGSGDLSWAGRAAAEVADPMDSAAVTPYTGPLTTLSLAMLAVGTSLFGVRRLASRAGRMR